MMREMCIYGWLLDRCRVTKCILRLLLLSLKDGDRCRVAIGCPGEAGICC